MPFPQAGKINKIEICQCIHLNNKKNVIPSKSLNLFHAYVASARKLWLIVFLKSTFQIQDIFISPHGHISTHQTNTTYWPGWSPVLSSQHGSQVSPPPAGRHVAHHLQLFGEKSAQTLGFKYQSLGLSCTDFGFTARQFIHAIH